jgi:HEAT repeat protein
LGSSVVYDIRGYEEPFLGNLGQAAQPYIQDILDFLKNEKVDAFVRGHAAVALGNVGQAAQPYIPDILAFLKNEQVNAFVRSRAAYALGNIRKLELNEFVVVLNAIYEPNWDNFEQWRFLTYFLSGGTDEVKTLLKWVGNPKALPAQLNYEEAKKTLEVFRDAWTATQGLERLRIDLANKIAIVAKQVSWKPQDIPLLQTHYDNLKKGGYNAADTVQSAIRSCSYCDRDDGVIACISGFLRKFSSP